ncbi:MAG: hypothetical protein ACR2NZ_04790 [Rubripirellula sp.]
MNRQSLSPDKPYLVIHEPEPDGQGGQVETTTVFLTVSSCPIGCSMCDLHLNTLPTATPVGAVPRQIETAVADSDAKWLKLYNSGNFFDPRSIPPRDHRAIAQHCQRFERVIVENHPRFGLQRLQEFQQLMPMQIEVAVGLETVQPRWLKRLGKQMSRDEFGAYANVLRERGIDLRVFLILGVPGISARESIRWARLSVRHAIASSARHISIIPARSGHGWNGQSDQLPTFSLDQLGEIQHQLLTDADGQAAITLDLWDVDRNREQRAKLQRANLEQTAWPTK